MNLDDFVVSELHIETEYDVFGHEDKHYGFTSVKDGITQAIRLSKDCKYTTRLISITYNSNGEYVWEVVATIIYSSVPAEGKVFIVRGEPIETSGIIG